MERGDAQQAMRQLRAVADYPDQLEAEWPDAVALLARIAEAAGAEQLAEAAGRAVRDPDDASSGLRRKPWLQSPVRSNRFL